MGNHIVISKNMKKDSTYLSKIYNWLKN